MEAVLDPGTRFRVEDLLNFSLDAGEEDDDDEKDQKVPSSSSLESSNPHNHDPDDHQSIPLPEFVEEELEWLLNKDAFPKVETCLDILSDNPGIVPNHHSPVSVLENTITTPAAAATSTSNSSTTTSCCGGSILVPVRYPVKARSTRQRRRRCSFSHLPSQQLWCWAQENIKNSKQEFRAAGPPSASAKIGRRCQHCLAEKTPQWRAGPMGPKTLCNACGVRYKSGRLVPEYRPASSPTFSSLLHSNSHRKVIEMRRQKQMGEMLLNEACGYSVG
ncbi:GATA transcription factor [Actinidia chinensis var. chinensis]|uniref:GATA transcription factor n=1 Tax=Actinidia chinensis var. chinensis TaxID=1590841 RepID=A0A2R6S0B7_ACTCC|nr:GATA transcription factor [Actinidia chinensis var. chinensis]